MQADLVAVRADVTLLTQCVVSTATALSDTATHVVVAGDTAVTAGAGAGAGSGSGEAGDPDADAATSDAAHILADPLASLSDTSAYSEQGVRESSHAIMKLVTQLKGQLEEAEHNEADLSERLHQTSTTLAEVRVRAAETEEHLVSETKQLRSELDSSTRRCESAQQEVAALSESVEEARTRVSVLETEVETLQVRRWCRCLLPAASCCAAPAHAVPCRPVRTRTSGRPWRARLRSGCATTFAPPAPSSPSTPSRPTHRLRRCRRSCVRQGRATTNHAPRWTPRGPSMPSCRVTITL